ncbi:MAG: hypothetical protein ISS18_03135 [Bacteroidales bacterium]|nr:hypothetical protein [Bacteroidales bacterium]
MKKDEKLWPYKKYVSFLLIPIIWIFFAVIFTLAKSFADWPHENSSNLIITIVIIISVIPLILVLLDFFASKGAVIDTKFGKIDFSKVNLNRPEIKQDSFKLDDNIGISGPIISDTAPMDIIKALEKAINSEIVVINIKDGNAWWVTRLLALSAGAVRAGSPNIFAFIGKKENIIDTFLGWGAPKDILKAILMDNQEYQNRYKKSINIAKQVIMYSDNQLLPQGMMLSNDVTRYTGDYNFTQLGDAVTEQIIMDQLAISYGYNTGSLEDKPDRLTLNRLNTLFGHCLCTEHIDLSWTNEEQIDKLINSNTNYLALVWNGQYDSMLKRDDGERLILRELLKQSKSDNQSK